MKARTRRFIRDEMITLSPALSAAALAGIIGAVMPRDFFLFLSVLIVLSVTAALAAFLPPVRAARARLIKARNIPETVGLTAQEDVT